MLSQRESLFDYIQILFLILKTLAIGVHKPLAVDRLRLVVCIFVTALQLKLNLEIISFLYSLFAAFSIHFRKKTIVSQERSYNIGHGVIF